MNKSQLILLGLLCILGMVSCEKHPLPPANQITSIESVTHTTAIVWAEILEEGRTTRSGIVYAQHQQPTIKDNCVRNYSGSPFRIPLISLESNTTYFIRSFTENEEGATYSHENQFTTDQVDLFVDHRDGNVYSEVPIFDQVWMGENMRYELPGESKTVKNGLGELQEDIHGLLYSIEVCENVCPSGWHLPTDEDWKELELAIGMPADILDNLGRRESDGALMLREPGSEHWVEDSESITNSLGFTALPAGYFDRYSNSNKDTYGYAGSFLTAPNDSGIYYRRAITYQGSFNKGIYRYRDTFSLGASDYYSIRCIKDN